MPIYRFSYFPLPAFFFTFFFFLLNYFGMQFLVFKSSLIFFLRLSYFLLTDLKGDYRFILDLSDTSIHSPSIFFFCCHFRSPNYFVDEVRFESGVWSEICLIYFSTFFFSPPWKWWMNVDSWLINRYSFIFSPPPSLDLLSHSLWFFLMKRMEGRNGRKVSEECVRSIGRREERQNEFEFYVAYVKLIVIDTPNYEEIGRKQM